MPHRVPSASEKEARDDYLQLFRPVRAMLATAEEYERDGEWDTAERVLRELLETSPQNASAHYRLAMLLEKQGKLAEAVAEYRRVPDGAPEKWEALYQLAVIHANDGQFEAAERYFEECVQACRRERETPAFKLAGVYLQWAILDKSQRQWVKAQPRLETAIELIEKDGEESLDSDNIVALARRELGDVLLSIGQVDAAIGHLTAGLERNPGERQSLRLLGEAYIRQKNWSEARKQFDLALGIAPDDVEALDGLATSLDGLGDREGALAAYRQAMEIGAQGEQKANLLFGQAKTQKALHRHEEAIASLKEAMASSKEAQGGGAVHVNAVNELALTLATCPVDTLRDGPQAVELAQKLVEGQAAPNAAYLDTLALAYAEAGQFPLAREKAETALQAAKAAGAPPELIAEIQMHLDLFKNEKPYRDQQP
jgi:tetratricopeptide (TPR) repeat protein